MEQNRYATKKKGKTEVYPFWNMADIKNVVEWFENNNECSISITIRIELKKKIIFCMQFMAHRQNPFVVFR